MGLRLIEVLTVLLTLHNCSHGAIFSEPSSQISFEGEISVFSCFSDGTLFWQINGELYDFSRAAELQSKGFVFSDTYSNGMVDRSISVVGSRETNNTVILCISVDEENEVIVSGNATLTVLGSPANVTLSRTDSSLFRLSWESPSTPLGYEPHNYTVTVSYKDGTTETSTVATVLLATNGTDSYTFNHTVSNDLLPLSSCSQFVFSVVSSSVMGNSQPVTLTWEMEQPDADPIETTECQLQRNSDDSTTAVARFTFPQLCHFQRATYSFSLSPADADSESVAESGTRHFVGGADRDVVGQLRELKLDLSSYYQVSVIGQLESGETIIGSSTICSLSDFSGTVDTGSLSVPTEDQSSLLVGIVIGSVFLFLTLVIYGTAIILVLCFKTKTKP